MKIITLTEAHKGTDIKINPEDINSFIKHPKKEGSMINFKNSDRIIWVKELPDEIEQMIQQ